MQEKYNEFNEDPMSTEEEMAGTSAYEEISEEELQSMMKQRKERYRDHASFSDASTAAQKQPNKKLMIAIMILIIVYFVTLYVLKVTGVIPAWLSAVCMLPAVGAAGLVYWRYRKKQ